MPDPFSIQTWRNIFTKHGRKLGWGLTFLFGIPLVVGFGLSGYGGRNQQSSSVDSKQNSAIAEVNGEPITQKQFVQMAAQFSRGAQPGEQFAQAQGSVMKGLISTLLIQQEAKKRNIRASDADIDRTLKEQRDKLMQKGTDSEWEQKIEEATGMSLSEYRDEMGKELLGKALLATLVSEEKVTPDEVKNQNAEVKINFVLIPTVSTSPIPQPTKGPKPLSDAEAKKKAEDLLAKVKAGADIAAIAKDNSSDFSAKQGGLLDFRLEYKGNPQMAMFGVLGYGKEFDEEIHKTLTGHYTNVIKIGGFSSGYGFAKIDERRNVVPKDFDPKKVELQLKQERATKRRSDLLESLLKSAKIEIKDPDKKAYYDYFTLQEMRQEQTMAQFGQGDASKAPTLDQVTKKQTEIDKEFEEMVKRHPDDVTAALVLAGSLKQKRSAKETSPAEGSQLRDRLITLYESALKSTENRDIRFELASFYHEKQQNDLAGKQYDMIARILRDDPPYDMNTMKTTQDVQRKLASGYLSINKPEEASKSNAEVTSLTLKIADEQKKQDAANKAAQAPVLTPPIIPNGVKGGIPTGSLPSGIKGGIPTGSLPSGIKGGIPTGSLPSGIKGAIPTGTAPKGTAQIPSNTADGKLKPNNGTPTPNDKPTPPAK